MREHIKNSQRFTTSAEIKPIYSKDYSIESCMYDGKKTVPNMCNAKVLNKFRLCKLHHDEFVFLANLTS